MKRINIWYLIAALIALLNGLMPVFAGEAYLDYVWVVIGLVFLYFSYRYRSAGEEEDNTQGQEMEEKDLDDNKEVLEVDKIETPNANNVADETTEGRKEVKVEEVKDKSID